MAVASGSPATGADNVTAVPVDEDDDQQRRDDAEAVVEPPAAAPKRPEASSSTVPPVAADEADTTSGPGGVAPTKAAAGRDVRASEGDDSADPAGDRTAVPERGVQAPVAMQARGILGGVLSGTDRTARTEAWAKIVSNPGHAPELLALAAVQTLGPRAKDWVEQVSAAYPNAGPDAVARLAQRQFTRFGSVSSIFAAVAGSYAPLALLGTNALTHAELALHIAAAYGLDPTDEARAVDLLVLTRVHPTREDAEAAVRTAKQPAYEDGGISESAWRLARMAALQTGAWAAVRVVNRFYPGTSLFAALMTSRSSALNMASRATAFYRQAAH